ncbi:penicillin-binding transpeptidase domain-containing protein [Cellulomonas wangsupingiae]|uniref:Beta-lactamase n=1 Tax=Cellulomonas wangsupingiae TaxID=2968085 RepID=A0ABY5K3S3_9CELL|nr:penicillin-binding transpeptidase domain-containing protein [Cellulomonas wangsupingiae]MCC2333723.1 penicillin-binding protein [Cellulomonas wangsupingiae]UUI64985.1 penicillin-binding transpeptidase domain-containing protein [Cellulomonas wangsupingiae]
MGTARSAGRARLRRWAAGGALVALTATTTVACSEGTPDARPAAEALAAALASGEFTDVPFTADAPPPAEVAAVRTAVVEGLGGSTATVEVGDVTLAEDEKTATAGLDVTWDLPGTDADWTYSATAKLVRDDEDEEQPWRARWEVRLLAPDLVAGERLTLTRAVAERGDVLGQGDAVLVEKRPVSRIGIDKTRVAEAELDGAARGLAVALGMDGDAYATRVLGAGPRAFVEAIVVRGGDAAYDVAALGGLPGVGVVPDELPLAPTRAFARPILGGVGAATAEIIEASEGAVAAGDLVGLSGLQRQYDAQLRGTPGTGVMAVAESGSERVLHTSEPVPGEPLRTTLDPTLQQRAEDVVGAVVPAAAVVALRPSTGEVLAAASGPGGEGLSTATVGQYAPGSTFKVVSALAYLRGGLTPDSTVTCPPTVDVDGRTFRNFPGYPSSAQGDVPLRTAFAHSCNTAFIGARDLADQGDLLAAARSLGLEPEADLGFPAFLGTVPDEASATAHAASVIGQGQVLASPLGMATVAASVAAGRTVVPRLVADAAGDVPEDSEGADLPDATPLTAEEAAALQGMMRAVVTEGGAKVLADVPGEPVLAKTGTAQFGGDDDLRNHAWMIAVQGDLAVAVFVGEGDYGSTTAGPLMRAFLAG